MFHLVEAWERVPPGRNPRRSVRQYEEHARERFLTPEEYRRLGRVLKEAEADGSVWPPAIAAIRLLVLTGCRHSEIVSLRWDDVDRTAGELQFRDAKAGPRMVPLTEPVSAVLAGIRREPGNPRVVVGQKPDTRLSSLPKLLALHPGEGRGSTICGCMTVAITPESVLFWVGPGMDTGDCRRFSTLRRITMVAIPE